MHTSESLKSELPSAGNGWIGKLRWRLLRIRYQTLNMRCDLLAIQIPASCIICLIANLAVLETSHPFEMA